MNREARTAIEALRAGVPNRAAVRLMGTDEPTLEHAFDEQMQLVWADHSRARPGLGIAGGFGILGFFGVVVGVPGQLLKFEL